MSISLLLAARGTLSNNALSHAFSHRHRKFKVVGSAHTRKDLLRQIEQHRPDVALISAELEKKPAGGLDVLRELRLARLPTRAIVLLDCSDDERVVEAFSQGARGVFCESEGFAALCKCIECVYAGEIWADHNQLRQVVQALEERKPIRIVSAAGAPLLTKREEEVVHMVTEGLPNSEIRRNLGLSPHTVKNHLFHIYNKLGISSRVELILYALSSRDALPSGDSPSKQSEN